MMLTTSMMPTRTLVMPRIPSLHQEMSSLRVFTGPDRFSFSPASTLTLEFASKLNLTIRMGGGPRTYPGGVSKWQWKRMQAKKSKQLLKARLLRERQIYEMRKRAELKAAISELERPWEMVEKAPTLFSVKADEQLKVLADRFLKPGGFDMWSEKDGPQVFRTPEGLPSARFFPKDAVHSVKPYGAITDISDSSRPTSSGSEGSISSDWTRRGNVEKSRRSKRLVPNSKGDIVGKESSASFVEDKQDAIAKKGVDFHRRSHDIYDITGRRSKRLVLNSKGDIVGRESSSSFVEDKQDTITKKGVDVHRKSHYDIYDNTGRRSKRLVPNSKGDVVGKETSTSFVDVHRKSHYDIYDSKSKVISNGSSYRSGSFNQKTSRSVTRQGAKWSSSDSFTRKAHSVKDHKPPLSLQSRRKLDFGLPYISGSDSSREASGSVSRS